MVVTLYDLTGWAGPGRQATVTGLAIDHRKVGPGMVFGAFPGVTFNGEDFIDAAIDAGAVAIVARPDAKVDTDRAAHIVAANPRQRFAEIAARFHGPMPAAIAAVTGTNGKTSVADLLRQIWARLGREAASLGTLGVITAIGQRDLGMTTPDVLTFLSTMAGMERAGINHVVFEASSHGLDQHRVDGLDVKAAAFTNLTRDHLDYHGTFEAYRNAKARLFSDLLVKDGTAVLWMDDPAAGFMAEIASSRGIAVLPVGTGETAATGLRMTQREVLADGQKLTVDYHGKAHEIRLPLLGGYQAANALVAAGLAIACGEQPAKVFEALRHVKGVPGRLQKAAVTPAGAPVFVDYAHTPDGLRAAIEALRPHCQGRLITVFGCGGDRDRGKRPQMGAVAASLSDLVYVTDDNPRSEEPHAIRAEILASVPKAIEIGDRADAIRAVMQAAEAGDLVLIAGKGHEQGQIVQGVVHPFDDVEVAARIARELAGHDLAERDLAGQGRAV